MAEETDKNKDEFNGGFKKKVLIKKPLPKVVVKRNTGESSGEGEKESSASASSSPSMSSQAPASPSSAPARATGAPSFSTSRPASPRSMGSSSNYSARPAVSARPSFARPASMAGKLEENTPGERTGGFGGGRPGGFGNRPAGGGFNRGGQGGGGFNRDGGGGRGGFNRDGASEGRGSYNRGGAGGGFNRGGAGGANRDSAPAPATGGSFDKRAADRRARAKKDSAGRYDRKDQEADAFLRQQRKKADAIASVPKSITMMENITIADLAKKMNLKASDLIGKLFGMGMMVTINQAIDADTATLLASEYECEVQVLSLYEETVIVGEVDTPEDLQHRPPIVTIMGHVDHGKTKLLDTIHSLDTVAGESGGITQHIGAYTVDTGRGRITFLDTPGHEAFTMMRARGAQITDIVVLVVAADDGVMPQTVEAIHHAKDANVPIIVAVNKMDLPTANPDRVKQQLSDYGLMPDAWGGTTAYLEVSARANKGIQELLDAILLQAEIMEIKANPNKRAVGHVIEAKVDPGRGVVSTVMVQEGTLKVGDTYVGGIFAGRVRALFDWKGEKIMEAPPSTPVEILGFDGLPSAGDPFQATENERLARDIAEKRQELKRQDSFKHIKKASLATLHEQKELGNQQEFKVIIKGDVQGSVEALKVSLEKLSTSAIALRAISASAGAITETDVNFAMAAGAIIIGFHVRPTAKAQVLADNANVEILRFNIIYDAIESVRSAMEGMLEPDLVEKEQGEVEVRKLFKVPKIGIIAGSYVLRGEVKRNSHVRVMRDGVQIHEGRISSLRREKDEAKEVKTGYECGIGLEGFQDIKEGDIFETYEILKVAKKL